MPVQIEPYKDPGVFVDEKAKPKCSQQGWCVHMDAALEPEANARRKGFSTLVVTNTKTGKERVVGIAFKKTANDRGIMLNHCPWCGAAVLWDGKE